MHARHLRKHILTHNRFVGGNYDARIRLHHTAHIIEAALVDIGNSAEMVFQDGLHAGKRRIPGTLAQTVNSGVQPLTTAQHGCQHIAHRKVVIIVRMEVEMRVRIAFHHFRMNSMTCNGFSTPNVSGSIYRFMLVRINASIN